MTEVASEAACPRPSSYHITLPDGWWRIDLRPNQVKGCVEALVKRQFSGINAPLLRRQLTEELKAQSAAAQAAGGVELYLSLMEASPLAIPASLLVSVPEPDERAFDLSVLADALDELESPTRSSLVVLPAGNALRRLTHSRLRVARPFEQEMHARTDGPNADQISSFALEYYIPIPGARGSLLTLSFASPIPPLEAALTDLFDAAARTLRWIK